MVPAIGYVALSVRTGMITLVIVSPMMRSALKAP